MCNWIWKWYRPGHGGEPADEVAETFAHLALRVMMTDGASTVATDWAEDVKGVNGALVCHAREIRHYTSQIESRLEGR